MIEGVQPFFVGDRVEWISESRLAGKKGKITNSGSIWSFVKIDGSEQEEYTRTALLKLVET
jgi:hypothetical protein